MWQVKAKARSSRHDDDHLGSFALAVPLVRRGYRNIILENYEGRRLTPANLFVHFDMVEKDKK